MANFFGHLITVIKHKNMVLYHCIKAGIIWRGLWHDISKFSPTEFIPGVKYFQGTRSPNDAQRECYGYSSAWMHHKGRNRHHFEYWTDYNPKTRCLIPIRMPLVFVKEMFCDRVAASKIYQKEKYTDKHPLEYFLSGRAKFNMHPDTAKVLESWLVMLAEKGENETFAYIRKLRQEDIYNE